MEHDYEGLIKKAVKRHRGFLRRRASKRGKYNPKEGTIGTLHGPKTVRTTKEILGKDLYEKIKEE